MSDLAGLVLAAGAGTRLAPLTRLRPKALCPVGNRPLLDHAIDRLNAVLPVDSIAVNLHHGSESVDLHLDRAASGVHRSHEQREALGTAGAIGALLPWIEDRDVIVTNADAWADSELDVSGFVAQWDRERVRLLTVETGAPSDFGTQRYCGVALLPGSMVRRLRAEPSGLYEAMWRREAADGRLDLVATGAQVIDCGTPRDYLRANLASSGGSSVLHPDARIDAGAVIERSVVWDHSEVHRNEHLVDAIRAQHLTVFVR